MSGCGLKIKFVHAAGAVDQQLGDPRSIRAQVLAAVTAWS
jgi:hypothetical protein